MRTTITISSERIKQARELTGHQRLSDAVDEVIDEAYRRRKRLEAIEWLFENKLPHDWKRIKAERRKRAW